MTDSPKRPRVVDPQTWSALTLAGAAVGLALAGPAQAAGPTGGPERIWLAQTSEGGEAGEAGAVESGDEVVDLLADLGLLEGHLRAGVALYRAGLADQAAAHMKRPEDDIYDELFHHLSDFGAAGFPAELTALADAVETGQTPDAVEAALDAVLAAIGAARGTSNASEAAEARAMVAILRRAAEAYEAAVSGGAVTDPEEYQEAWGFVETVRAQAGHMANEDDAAEKAFGETALAALDAAREALPDVSPEGRTPGDASILHAAAARIELAAYRLK